MNKPRGFWIQLGVGVLVTLLLSGLGLWWTYPFKVTLLESTTPMGTLTAAQQQNIGRAAQKLNGWVLRPGERFSFNAVVGPRTERAGFIAAPTYLKGAQKETSVGGGICLVSSKLYQMALQLGLPIQARKAHLKPIGSVPPGLDATVWHSPNHQVDLQFQNPLPFPIQLQARILQPEQDTRERGQALSFRWVGQAPVPKHKITTRTLKQTAHQLTVQVFRQLQTAHPPNANTLISTDEYLF